MPVLLHWGKPRLRPPDRGAEWGAPRRTTVEIRWAGDAFLEIYLVDGTYELFRHYYALPSARDRNGCEIAAVRGVLASVLRMIKGGATHIAVGPIMSSSRFAMDSGRVTRPAKASTRTC